MSKKNFISRHRNLSIKFWQIVLTWLLLILLVTTGEAHDLGKKSFVDKKGIEYQDDVKVWKLLESQRRCAPQTSLNIRARLLSGDEDERSENFQTGGFYLLGRNIVEILRELKLEPIEDIKEDEDNNGNNKKADESLIKSSPPVSSGAYLEAAARILLTVGDHSQKSGGYSSSAETFGHMFYPAITFEDEINENNENNEENQLLALLIYAKLAEAKAVKVETNNFGWRQNTAVCTGDYFLFGYGRFGDHILVWQVPVSIMPGTNVVELDQYNAEIITEF